MRSATNRSMPGASRRGFTLVELMIVIVVLGIVSMLGVPSFTRVMANNAVKGAANEAYADLQYARSESVQRNATVTVTFSTSGYQITAAGGTTLKVVTLNGPNLAAGVGATVVFSPTRATAAVTGSAPQFAHSQTDATLRVIVNTLGRVEMCSPSASMTGYTAC